MNRPLFICPEYGSNDVNAVIEDIIISSLDKSKFQPTVLCKGNGERNNNVQTIEVKQNTIIKKIECYFRTFIMSPDTYFFSWAIPSISRILRTKKMNFSYVHSVSIPYSTHFIGYFIHKWYKIPWVAHFFEPWEDNPYVRPKKNFVYNYFLRKCEAFVARNADVIIHNNSVIIESWKRKYGVEVCKKLFLLSLPFDQEKMNKKQIIRNGNEINISHIGNLYSQRNASELIMVVKELVEQDTKFADRIKINLIGQVTQADKDLITSYNLQNVFNLTGHISEEECNGYYNRTDYFLVIEGKNQGLLFYPSKIIKYFYYEKPIIGITSRGSVLDLELKKTGNISIYYDRIDRLKEIFIKIINNDVSLHCNNKLYWKNFCKDFVNNKYMEILEQKSMLTIK